MSRDLLVDVEQLIGHPESSRNFVGELPVRLRLGDTVVEGAMSVDGVVTGAVDGVIARFGVSAPGRFTCARCLSEWTGAVAATGEQHFSRIQDEDGYSIDGRHIDMSGPATDELALAMPARPLCMPECRGLCPICGTDLNTEPCDGHGEDSDSPFAVLRDLFDS